MLCYVVLMLCRLNFVNTPSRSGDMVPRLDALERGQGTAGIPTASGNAWTPLTRSAHSTSAGAALYKWP